MKIQIINNEKVNCLALTSMVKAGFISSAFGGTYAEFKEQGWDFFFERREGKLYSIMTADFPHGTEYKEVKTDVYITDTVLKIMREHNYSQLKNKQNENSN